MSSPDSPTNDSSWRHFKSLRSLPAEKREMRSGAHAVCWALILSLLWARQSTNGVWATHWEMAPKIVISPFCNSCWSIRISLAATSFFFCCYQPPHLPPLKLFPLQALVISSLSHHSSKMTTPCFYSFPIPLSWGHFPLNSLFRGKWWCAVLLFFFFF